MQKPSYTLEFLNTYFKHKSGASIIACYAIIIEYFSSGEYPLTVFFQNYCKYFRLSISPALSMEELISRQFHDHCSARELGKFEFVQQFHLENLFNTRTYCKIRGYKSDPYIAGVKEVSELRHKLKEGGLAMVLFPFKNNSYHTIVVGYDRNDQRFFKRDPAKKAIIFEDFLARNQILEYILFVERYLDSDI